MNAPSFTDIDRDRCADSYHALQIAYVNRKQSTLYFSFVERMLITEVVYLLSLHSCAFWLYGLRVVYRSQDWQIGRCGVDDHMGFGDAGRGAYISCRVVGEKWLVQSSTG